VSGTRATQGRTPTKQGDVALPGDPVAHELLRAHRMAQRVERLKAGGAYRGRQLVFATAQGALLTHANLWRSFKGLMKRLGLPDCRLARVGTRPPRTCCTRASRCPRCPRSSGTPAWR